jgi:hypothetical protein
MGRPKKSNTDPAADNIDNIEIVQTKTEEENLMKEDEVINDDTIPAYGDEKWSEYVLSQFELDELVDGNPNTDGLRRIANKVLGTIIKSRPIWCSPPGPNNNTTSTIMWELEIEFGQNDIRVFGDIADVSPDNTDGEYAKYPSATAATRAEGRALRKALLLRRVLAAEEVSDDKITDDIGGKINSNQISFMNMVCERMNINVRKLINMGKDKYDKIEDIPYGVAVVMNKFINDIQNSRRDMPESITGYDSDWRK